MDVEEFVFQRGQFVEDGLHTAGLGVGEEHLAESVAAHKGYQLLDTQHVELVEDIIEEQYGFLAVAVDHVLELGEFEGQSEAFLLSLRAEAFDAHLVVEHQHEVVLVRTDGGVLRILVCLTGVGELNVERACVGGVVDDSLFAVTGNPVVVLVEERSEVGDEVSAGVVETLAVGGELRIVDGHHAFVPQTVVPHLLQQLVAHLQRFVVLQQVQQVFVVGLGEYAVDETAAHVAAAGDNLLVGRRHHDERQLADMFGQGLVGLLVPTHLLALAATQQATGHVVAVMAVDGEEVLAHPYVLYVYRVEVTLAEREVVDGIEEVGFSSTVVADEAVDIATECYVGLGVVLEIRKYQPVQRHCSCLLFLNCSATSSISHLGVDVAPLIPMLSAPSSHSCCTSAALPTRYVRGCTLRQYS